MTMTYATQSAGTPTESTATDAGAETDQAESTGASDAGRRDVIVPLRVYKAVTVFSTLFAILAIVVGFVVLDTATNRGMAAVSAIDPLLALLGLGSILFGAVVYAFSTRFRTEGMAGEGGETDG
ncbi:hypothetical protein Huta_0576 [Halorhabdus utahensis DSM 12940]|uniref:DUF7315 domain-containing protein n=1 Tax=Halorhabdus utahensis (strain DSM 12940 / JCM 11049 / AX-2) TaxID=519442 RepID=C7NSV2_HALUD|nr:hypothetical protein Huta_0576 [Halorhabdus utahensis DSM 12940]